MLDLWDWAKSQDLLQDAVREFTVSALTAHVRSLLDADPVLADLWVVGEVSNVREYRSRHVYFTLKDSGSELRCVLFSQQRRKKDEALEDGRLYRVRGSVSVYEARGEYQLYVAEYARVGVGELYLRLEEIRARLNAEGLFALERKRPLPLWPRRIGLVTSRDGAVVHDLCRAIGARYPLVELVLCHTQVQGADAPTQIVRALRTLDQRHDLDLIVVARGGGSVEDLWAFNDEAVARALAACRLPVVTAIGHEVDHTVADDVADVVAPTPSAAGQLIVPDREAILQRLRELTDRSARAMRARLHEASATVAAAEERLHRAGAARLDAAQTQLALLEGRLTALSPLAILRRGYAVVRDAESLRIVKSVGQVTQASALDVLVADGRIGARVTWVAHHAPAQSPQGSD